MKIISKIGTLAFLFVSIHTIFAQKYIEWQYVDSTYSLINPVEELEDGRLIAGVTGNDTSLNYLKLIILNKEGQLQKSKDLVNDSVKLGIRRIVVLNGGKSYLIIGAYRNISEPPGQFKNFYTAVVNENLEAIKFNLYPIGNMGPLYNMSYYKVSDDTILVAVNGIEGLFGPDSKDMYVMLNGKGEIIKQHFNTGFPCLSILPSNQGYDCIGIELYKFDRELNLIVKKPMPKFYFGGSNQSYAVRISPTRILGGDSGSPLSEIPDGAGPSLYLLDNNYNLKKFAYLYTPPMSIVPIDVFDITPDSSIYLSNYESVGTAFASFTMAKFDMNFNKKWQLHHTDDPDFRYRYWNMEATNDNGVLLYGIWYSQPDWIPMAGMLKINENGNLVWTHNVPADGFHSIKVSPNPATDILKIDIRGIEDKTDLRLFDMAGRNVYVHSGLQQGENSIDISGLPAGTYIYKLYRGSREAGRGEVVRL